MKKILDLLPSMKLNAVYTFCEEKNNGIDCFLNESSEDKVRCFTKLFWFLCFLMVESHVVQNPDEIVVEIGHQGFTAVTSSLHEFFTGMEFSCYVRALFDATESMPP